MALLTPHHGEGAGPRAEFRNKDTRPIHQLNEVLPPSRLKQRLKAFEEGHASEQQEVPSHHTFPKLQVGNKVVHAGAEDNSKSSWSPVAAARLALASEKPGLIQRMDQCVNSCRIDRDNRSYRLNSLGVFDVKHNDVRAKSMFRVSVYKELSATSMRMPAMHKETKVERTADTVNARLERMFARVLKSIHEPRRSRPVDLSVGGAAGAAAGASDQRRAASTRDGLGSTAWAGHSLRRHSRPSFSGVSRPGSRAATATRHSVTTGGMQFLPSPKPPGMTSLSRQPQELDIHIPPEAAAEQVAHLTQITEQHLAKYHAAVCAAQAKVLASAGLPVDVTLHQVDTLAAHLEQERRAHEVSIQSIQPDDEPRFDKEISRVVHNTKSIPDMIKAAIEHVTSMSEDLEQLKATLPHPHANENRRRKPSVPLNALKQQQADARTPSPAAVSPGTEDADSSLWPVLLGNGALPRTASWDGASQDAQQEQDGLQQGKSKVPSSLPKLVLPEERDTAPRSLPSINHTPITAKKLSHFLEALACAVEEVQDGTYKLDGLPTLDPPAVTASQHVQARLERVWDLLQLPLASRLDTVLSFTARERAGEFEIALELWEQGTAAILHREELLGSLSAIQQAIAERRTRQVSVKELERQLIELHKVTHLVLSIADKLLKVYGIALTFNGDPYPGPDVVGEQDMVQLLHWLRDDCTHVYIMA